MSSSHSIHRSRSQVPAATLFTSRRIAPGVYHLPHFNLIEPGHRYISSQFGDESTSTILSAHTSCCPSSLPSLVFIDTLTDVQPASQKRNHQTSLRCIVVRNGLEVPFNQKASVHLLFSRQPRWYLAIAPSSIKPTKPSAQSQKDTVQAADFLINREPDPLPIPG